jgi:hypothetical protein
MMSRKGTLLYLFYHSTMPSIENVFCHLEDTIDKEHFKYFLQCVASNISVLSAQNSPLHLFRSPHNGACEGYRFGGGGGGGDT